MQDGSWQVLGEEDVGREARFLLAALAPFLGRHVAKCGLLCGLAHMVGVPVESVVQDARRLSKVSSAAPPADPALRPPPRTDFLSPPHLLPRVLMAWDFCQTYRWVFPIKYKITMSRS